MSFLYYLKKCGHQELGSIGEDGKANRGRYLYISKSDDVLCFFPPLSESQVNDSAIIPVIPLVSNTKKIYCNYVYHNDVYHGGTRNEYRLYLNKALEETSSLFKKDDIVIFRQENIIDNAVYREDEQEYLDQTVYLMLLLNDHTSPCYQLCNSIINNHRLRGNHALYDQCIEEFECKAERLDLTTPMEVEIDSSVIDKINPEKKKGNDNNEQGKVSSDNDSTNASNNMIVNLFTSVSFRDFVMAGYNNMCAITGQVIRYKDLMNLEAAHIKPKSHGGSYLPNNGIALCRDMHWAFDKGFFKINEDYTITVHPAIESEYLRSFDGKKIRLPANPFFIPDKDSLKYHREHIYELFYTSGRL